MIAEGPESKQLWSLVSYDPALLCSLFRAANSSFFAGLQKTLSIQDAVTRLGSDKAAQVVERACREGEGCPQGELLPRYMPSLWQHAQGCALGARWLANRCSYQGIADQAYLAGLLHDIGKQFLLAALEEIASCGEFGITLSRQLVQEVLTTMHVEQGLRLFEDWNLPEVYKEVVADHHGEELDKQNTMVALVKLANKGCRKLGLGWTKQPDIVFPTTGEAQFLGIDEIALAEFEIMLEDRFLGAGQT
ncbi:MAG: phosphohydrolase [Gammaproteobacteria bacterium]|nr:MAG: phosphohydrolase [Gammaproteobacteria bacterium]